MRLPVIISITALAVAVLGATTISSDPVGVIVNLRHSASNELIDGIFYIAAFCPA